jgi:hypothetical protein
MENDELTVDKEKFEIAQSNGCGQELFSQVSIILRNSGILDTVMAGAFTTAAFNNLNIDREKMEKMIEKKVDGKSLSLCITPEDLIIFSSTIFRFGFWAALMSVKHCDLDINKLGK